MRIVNEWPPNIEAIRAVLPLNEADSPIFAYGDIIYFPLGADLGPEKIAHEETHGRRQLNIGVDRWWDMYLHDAQFRLEEELLAYTAEYRAFCTTHTNGRERYNYLIYVARELASPLYGSLLSPIAAAHKVNMYAKD